VIAASFEQVTDVIGVALALVMVALFAAVDLLPEGRLARRVSGLAAGSVFTVLMVVVAYRFSVLAE
jgi:tetrahydromethanopterin S-methyltransferase subunit F